VSLMALLPESPERDLHELELRRGAFLILRMIRGHTAPETIDALERAGTLAERSGKLSELVTLLVRRGWAGYFSGHFSAAGVYAGQALELALRESSATSLADVHFLQILTRHIRGDLDGAEVHFAAGIKFFDDSRFRQNPNGSVVATFGGASWNAWILGRANVARARMAQMMARVDPDKPFYVATSSYYAAYLRVYMREHELAEALAAQALQLCEKHQFPQFAAYSRCVLGQARAQLGRSTEGIELIREGIGSLLEAGARAGIMRQSNYLAEALEREGDIVSALETVNRALEQNPEELLHRPETLRLRGELRLKQQQTEIAEADLREAIELARRMNAKSWELRATTSLARLLAKQGNRDEARAMLADIYNWFTEGFDTADLKDAKALLDELSA
jgi:tetratricopeptide (TPR) repeat protein